MIVFTGCGIKVTPGGPVTVNPITVSVSFNLSELTQYFTALCEKQLNPNDYPTTDAYNAAVVECSNADVGQFLIAFPGVIPTPTPAQ